MQAQRGDTISINSDRSLDEATWNKRVAERQGGAREVAARVHRRGVDTDFHKYNVEAVADDHFAGPRRGPTSVIDLAQVAAHAVERWCAST